LEKIGVQITVVDVRNADFEVVVVSNPTNCNIYPKPRVVPIMNACFRKCFSLSFFGKKRTRMPLRESSEIARNIPRERTKRIAAKRMGETSARAFCTMENVVPQTAVRIVRIIMARVFLLSGGTR
jgi:hypothetical protein